MKRIIIKSDDGSETIYVPELEEHYHSTFGAISESRHIFINQGFLFCCKDHTKILEIGFGTGLNAFLTLIEAIKRTISVSYTAIEKYPLGQEEWERLNYPKLLEKEYSSLFPVLHNCEWENVSQLHPYFTIQKHRIDLKDFIPENTYDIIYFDAFAPGVQPDLWTKEVFLNLYNSLNAGGVLITYSVKGSVKSALKEAGFSLEKLQGPRGKRHTLRAIKN